MSRAHAFTNTGHPARRKLGIARCFTVWLTLTALAVAGTHACVMSILETLAHRQHTTPDASVLLVAACVGALACPWVWLVSTSTVIDHLRGRDVRSAGVVRRLVLLACGVAVTFTASPVHAHVLDGLPFPDRASNVDTPAHDPRRATLPSTPSDAATGQSRQTPVATSSSVSAHPDRHPDHEEPQHLHVVRPGDSLWRIAAEHAGVTDPEVVRALVRTVHETNREVIGSDPDLVHPGQELVLPVSTTTAPNEVSR